MTTRRSFLAVATAFVTSVFTRDARGERPSEVCEESEHRAHERCWFQDFFAMCGSIWDHAQKTGDSILSADYPVDPAGSAIGFVAMTSDESVTREWSLRARRLKASFDRALALSADPHEATRIIILRDMVRTSDGRREIAASFQNGAWGHVWQPYGRGVQ